MKRAIVILGMILCVITVNLTINNTQASYVDSDNLPAAKQDGTKWQIGYCESESFISYTEGLVGIVNGLYEIGWVTNLEGFDKIVSTGDSREIWMWLASNEVSPYIEFVDNAFYNLRQPGIDREGIVEGLQNDSDLDVMLVMGTDAGILLSSGDHNTNIFVFAASNAVRSGIIASVEDSGKDHVWAHMDQHRFTRQLNAFYDIVKFEKLGMVYEDSDIARVYSAVNEVEILAKEKGFQIIRYHVDEPRTPEEFPRYYQEVQQAYNELAVEVDAIYLTVASLDSEKLPELFVPFYNKKIPVFSQLGNIEVQNGALMTISIFDYVNIGRFGADTISKCLQGAKPRELEQSFQSAPRIVLNAEVAKKIDFKLPFELVIVTDEVYQYIGTPPE